LSVYENLSKNSFFSASPVFDFSSRKPAALGIAQVDLALHSLARFLGESGCKGTHFSTTNQILWQLFFKNNESFPDYLQKQLPTPYI
jgi:hypothetical protein